MTKAITITDVVRKINNVLKVSDNNISMLPWTAFKKIMMLYPEDGPVISNERNVKEKYRTLQEFGVLNDSGRINADAWHEILAE